VKKTLSHGMQTLSSHICASSSSKRLLKGVINGFMCLTAILRQTTVTPGGRHRDDECDPMRTARHLTDCAYVDILCEGKNSGMQCQSCRHHGCRRPSL